MLRSRDENGDVQIDARKAVIVTSDVALEDKAPTLPFAPGESPFHIKGISYEGAIKQYDRLVPGGTKALRSAIGDPDLARFFGQRFLPSGWYDILPMIRLDALAASLNGQSLASFVAAAAEIQANSDMRGVYKIFLWLFKPDLVLRKLISFSKQYIDFGSATTRTIDGYESEVIFFGCPTLISTWYALAAAHYGCTVIHHAGAKNIQLHVYAPEVTPEPGSGSATGRSGAHPAARDRNNGEIATSVSSIRWTVRWTSL